jgi:hypothetical protein
MAFYDVREVSWSIEDKNLDQYITVNFDNYLFVSLVTSVTLIGRQA